MADKRRDVHDSGDADDASQLRVSAVPAASVPIERVLAHLAEQPAPDDLLAACAEPTWEDVRSVMRRSGERTGEVTGDAGVGGAAPRFVTPQEFYTESMQRADVRDLLRRLTG